MSVSTLIFPVTSMHVVGYIIMVKQVQHMMDVIQKEQFDEK